MKTNHKNDMNDAMSKNPNNWKGIFYFNRNDPRIMLPKLFPAMGWTLNFASIYAWLFIIALAIIVVGFSIFI